MRASSRDGHAVRDSGVLSLAKLASTDQRYYLDQTGARNDHAESVSSGAGRTTTAAARRARKDYGVTPEMLAGEWRQRARELGLDDRAIDDLLGHEATPTRRFEEIADELASPRGLTAQASTFDRRDVVRACLARGIQRERLAVPGGPTTTCTPSPSRQRRPTMVAWSAPSVGRPSNARSSATSSARPTPSPLRCRTPSITRCAGIESSSVAALLGELRRGTEWGLSPRSVLIVDEAGMLGTRDLAELLTHAAATRAKVVLVGDHHQLPEINARGAFRALVTRTDPVRLTVNRRQHEPHAHEMPCTTR